MLRTILGCTRRDRSSNEIKKKSDSLEDPEYYGLIRKLYEDGSEIAPHALSHSGNLLPGEFRDNLYAFSSEFHPQTWIDHGAYISYCYTMGGGESPQYRLLDHLAHLGYQAIWSYYDLPKESAYSMNNLSRVTNALPFALKMLIKNVRAGRILPGLHYVRNYLRTRFQNDFLYAVIDSLSATARWIIGSLSGKKNSLKSFRRLRKRLKASLKRLSTGYSLTRIDFGEINGFAPILFGTQKKPFFFTNPEDLFLFTTLKVSHPRDVYRSCQLDSLLEEYGLHIGHTYLLGHSPHLNGAFVKEGAQLALSADWMNFVDYLSLKKETGELWNPCMSEFTEFIRSLKRVRFVYGKENKLILSNEGEEPVKNITVFIDASIPVQNILWNGKTPLNIRSYAERHVVWGDLGAAGEVVIQVVEPAG